LYDRFSYLGPWAASYQANFDTMSILLKEFGLVPRDRTERELFNEDLWTATTMYQNNMDFHGMVHFICNRRESRRKMFAEQLSKYFDFYDRDKSGLLTMAEVSSMLEHLNLTPRTRVEQDNIRELFLWLDKDGAGKICRHGFQLIYIRMDEQIRQLQYECRHSCAQDLGFSEAEIQEMMDAFDTTDQEGSGLISLMQAKQVCTVLRKSYTYEQVADALGDVLLENGMVDFFGILQALAPPAGKSAWAEEPRTAPAGAEGGAGAGGNAGGGNVWPEGLTTRPLYDTDWISPRILRQALRYMRLPKDYVISLEDSELQGVLLEYFGIDMPSCSNSPSTASAGDEDLQRLLLWRLGVHSSTELHKVARQLGAMMEKESEEDYMDRGDASGATQDVKQFPPRFHVNLQPVVF